MTTNISNTDSVIDSRDIIERIEFLEQELEDELDLVREDHPRMKEENLQKLLDKAEKEYLESSDGEELKSLRKVADQCDGYGDWEYGEPLIHDSYWQDYIKELIEDCYMTAEMRKMMSSWPWRHLDLEAAAEEAKDDYMEVDFGGEVYWMRSA